MNPLTRRRWMQGIAAAWAGSVTGSWYHPLAVAKGVPGVAAEPAKLALGFSLYNMKGMKMPEALGACAELGYDGVELALMPEWPAEPKRLAAEDRRDLRKRLVDSKLSLISLMENLKEPADDTVHRANLDCLKAAAELGHALSPDSPPVLETVLGGKPAQWPQVKDRLVERLGKWAEAAAAAKLVVTIKPHVGNALHTPDDARWLIEQINSPNLRLAFDYSHFALRNFPLPETLAALIPLSAFVHVKDCRGTADKFEFLLPGEGTIDYGQYFSLLRSAGYRGGVVVEVSAQISTRPGYDPLSAARQSYTALSAAMKKAEVR